MYCHHGICYRSKFTLPGYFVECLSEGVVQDIFADNNGTPIISVSGVANRAVADQRGNFNFYVPSGVYDLKYYDAQGVFQFSETGFTMFDLESVANTGFTTPEAFGAVGDGVANDQPAIQAAIDYARSNGIPEVRFMKTHYRVYTKTRTLPMSGATTWDSEGHPIVIASDHAIALTGAGNGQTRLEFRMPDGSSFQGTTPGTNFQVVSGAVFRGDGILIKTTDVDPGQQQRSHLTLKNLWLDGGTQRTFSGGSWPANPADGTGWDIWHKAIAVEPDKDYGGSITLRDCSITGWRGEAVYTANNAATAKSFLNVQDARIEECEAQAINPNPLQVVRADGLIVKNCRLWFEGWLGREGYVCNSFFTDCEGTGPVQGGTAGGPGSTWAATRLADGKLPMGRIQAQFRNCGPVALGSWLDIDLVCIDTNVNLGGASIFPSGAQNVQGRIHFIADAETPDGLLIAASAVAATKNVDNISLAISFGRTADAVAAARKITFATQYYGSLGPNLRIDIAGLEHCTNLPSATSTVTDFAPLFTGDLHYHGSNTNNFQNVETTPTIALTGPVCALSTTGSGVYNAILPTTNVQRGKEITLRNINGASGGVIKFVAAEGTSKMQADGDVYLPGICSLRLKFNGSYWEPMSHAVRADTILVTVGDEASAITAGAGKATFSWPPYICRPIAIRGRLATAQTSGSIFTADINEAGVTILSTALTIDNTEETSTSAVAAAVISDTSIAANAKGTIDVDQVGDGTAKGLKVEIDVIRA